MARFQISAGFDSSSFHLGDFALGSSTATTSSLSFRLGGSTLTVLGSFTLAAGEAVEGTVSQITLANSGATAFQMTELTLSLQDLTDAMADDSLGALLGGRDQILGSGQADRLYGHAGDDLLSGAAGNDLIYGGRGGDVLDGGSGDDLMQGGTGDDVYMLDSLGDRAIELRGGGIDRIETGLSSFTLGANLENLTYLGSGTFAGSGNALANVILGGGGNDLLSGLDGNDTLRGGNGDDTLQGGAGDDLLVGDAAAAYVTTSASQAVGGGTLALSMTLPELASGTSTVVTGYVTTATLSQESFNLAFVLDVSGSMADGFSGSTVGDLNGDGRSNTKLDAVIAGFEALVSSLQAAGMADLVHIALIPFSNSGAVLYEGDIATDADGNGRADVLDAARSLTTVDATDYDAGLSKAIEFLESAPPANNSVFFLSDGQPSYTNYAADLLTLREASGLDASIRSLGFEAASFYDTLDQLDDGMLNDSAINVLVPGDLTAGLLGSQIELGEIDHLEIWRNGTKLASLTPDQLIETPFGLRFSYTVAGLTPSGADRIETRIVLADPEAGYISTAQVLSGGAFNSDDRLVGGTGNDTLDGGAGIDTLVGGAGDDVYRVERLKDVITEAADAGTDRIESTVSYSLNIKALAAIENLTLLGSGNLSGIGNALDNRITGTLGDNLLEGMAGNDTLVGGYGSDMASYEHAAQGVSANLQYGTATTGGETDTLIQIEGVKGSAFADLLQGSAGDDRFIGLAGNDSIYGGDGMDMLDLSQAGSAMTVRLNQNSQGGTSTSANGAEGTDQLRDIEAVLGSRYGDVITDENYGAYLDNLFYGGAGADSLMGGSGNDTLIGGAGDDTLDGGNATVGRSSNNDLLDYSAATAGVHGALDGLVIGSATGRDTVRNFEHVIATDFNDSLTGTSVAEWLEGGAGADQLSGGAGNDTLDGGPGRDTLAGGLGDDVFIVNLAGDLVSEAAGEGNDRVEASVSYAIKDVDVEALLLTGSAALEGTGNAAANTITGNGAANLLSGQGGADTILGGDGDDTILGGGGADSLDGGNGRDLVSFADSTAAVSGSLNGSSYASFTSTAGTDSLRNFEDVTGSKFADTLGGDYGDNVISGGAGNDLLSGGYGDDTLAGGAGDDTLDGGYGLDAISYQGLSVGIVADLSTGVIQGQGRDTILNTSIETITGTAQADSIAWTSTTQSTYADFTLYGGQGNDTLTGSSGDDTLDGGAGGDVMTGGGGYDTYIVDNANDQVVESLAYGGTDTVISSLASTTLGANVENLTLTGSAVTGIGNGLRNLLTGTDGDNVLRAGAESDTLIGGLGADTLDGGADTGYDRFLLQGADDSTQSQSDLWQNFDEAYDTIDLHLIDASSLTDYDQSFTFVYSAAFSGAAGELRYGQQDGMTLVEADLDGDRQADVVIRIEGLHVLNASDFYL